MQTSKVIASDYVFVFLWNCKSIMQVFDKFFSSFRSAAASTSLHIPECKFKYVGLYLEF